MSEGAGELVPTLSLAAARALTDEAKADAAALWLKLLRLYEGGAHVALGYASWAEYYEGEFGESKSHGYRLLEAARVDRALAHSPIGERPASEAVARVLAPLEGKPELAAAWTAVVEAHQGDGAITARETKQVLVREGFLPDTSGTGRSAVGWSELLGRVGDSLIAAERNMTNAEAAITRTPVERLREKAGQYAEWADDAAEQLHALADRLRAVAQRE